jgi:hypothetical protein
MPLSRVPKTDNPGIVPVAIVAGPSSAAVWSANLWSRMSRWGMYRCGLEMPRCKPWAKRGIRVRADERPRPNASAIF